MKILDVRKLYQQKDLIDVARSSIDNLPKDADDKKKEDEYRFAFRFALVAWGNISPYIRADRGIAKEIRKLFEEVQTDIKEGKTYIDKSYSVRTTVHKLSDRFDEIISDITAISLENESALRFEPLWEGAGSVELYFEDPAVLELMSQDQKDDILQAMQCLSLGISNPAILLMSRVVESVFRQYATRKNIEVDEERDTLEILLGKVQKHVGLPNELKQRIEFVKDFFRNPSAHARKNYGLRESERGIFGIVLQVVEKLAGDVSAATPVQQEHEILTNQEDLDE